MLKRKGRKKKYLTSLMLSCLVGGGEDQFPKEKKNQSVGMCLSGESLASVKWGKKDLEKKTTLSLGRVPGLLTQAVCSNAINKLKAVAPCRDTGWGVGAAQL